MQILERLFGYVRPYWRPLIVTATLLLLHTGLSLLPPLFQQEIVDQVIGTRDLSHLGVMIVAMVGVHALLQFVDFGGLLVRAPRAGPTFYLRPAGAYLPLTSSSSNSSRRWRR